MATTRLYAPRPYDSIDFGIAGVAPILPTGTDVDNTKLAAVQAAAVAGGYGTLSTSAGGTAPAPVAEPLRFRGAWQANTVYSYGDAVNQAGVLYVAPISFTSGSSFVAANWTRLGVYDATDPAFLASYESLVAALLTNSGQTANAPADLTRATAPLSTSALSIHTGVGTGDDVVEPTVLYDAAAPFLGYEYVMCAAPYYTSNPIYENPTLWVSHDGTAWVPVIAGVPTPGGTPSALVANGAQGDGTNSDPTLVRGPDGTYYILWNQFLNATGSGGTGTGSNNWSIKGISASSLAGPWTSPVTLVASVSATTRPASPSIFWDGTTWHLYGVDLANTSSTAIVHYTNPSANPLAGTWTAQATITAALPAGYTGQVWWHLNAYRWGTNHVLLVQDTTAGTSAGGNLWLLISQDSGATWTVPTAPVLTTSLGYRAALVAGSGSSLDLFYGYLGATWQMFRTTISLAPLGRTYGGVTPAGLPYSAVAVLAAKVPISPYVFGDSAIRADNAAAVGNADSGQSYTVSAGTPGISGNAIYATIAGNTRGAVLLTGCADGVTTCDFPTVSTAQSQFILARYTDASNYVRCGCAGDNLWSIQNIVAGSVAQNVAAPVIPGRPLSGDSVTLVHRGSTIRVYVNGALILTVTGWTSNASGSGVGFQISGTAPRLRNLTARPLVGGA